MDKPIFYCDCDGVILNTIEVAFNIMKENGCDISNRKEVDYYFKKIIDWNEIFSKAKYINNSIEQIKLLKEQDIFKDIIILTKLSGSIDEERLKRDLFKEVLPDIRVITLQYGLNKSLVVPSKGNILLDDEINNCKEWKKEKGIAILFSPYMSSYGSNVISNISDVPYTKEVKKLIKTRKF